MSKAKILLVDDEELVRDELGGLLEDEGYDVVTGSDGEEGLALFTTERPDLVITDVRMPRVDGLTFVAAIRKQSPTTPITVITGHGNEATAIDALRAGVTDFIKKPVRFDDLLASLDRMEAALRMNRSSPPQLPSSATLREQSWVYDLGNNRGAIPDFVDAILATCVPEIDPQVSLDLSLALRELLLNAVEHGNLALTYAEKTHALEEGSLEGLLDDRRKQSPYATRRARVHVQRDESQVLFEIHDEGDGFDWRKLPDPMDPLNLLADHGRGVLLATLAVDELRYNEAGTTVTAIKRLT